MQFIHLVKGAYPKRSCTFLIDFFETNISLAKQGSAGNKKLDNLEIGLDIDFKNPNPNNFGLENTLENILYQYKNKFPLIDSSIGRWHVSPTCQLAKYEPNNFGGLVIGQSSKIIWFIFFLLSMQHQQQQHQHQQ